jgi:DNA mismatch repair protein MutS2
MDLDPETRRALEFDAVLELVASHAVSAGGAALLSDSTPLADPAAISTLQDGVEEVSRHLVEQGRLLPGALPDPRPALAVLAVEGMRVEAAALRDLASAVAVAADLKARILRLPAGSCPVLGNLVKSIPDLRGPAGEVLEHVGPDGRIADGASPELRRVRAAHARVGERLKRMLESFLHDPASGAVIRDDFVTQRNGRFVIPVRSDSPRPVKGIVHASSSSGATLFVEPLESVELNNDLVRFAEREVEERERVVRSWADRFRAELDAVLRAVEGLSEADGLQARALFGEATGGVRARLCVSGGLELVDARHPLLDRRLAARGERCVPIRVRLEPEERVLVLSGPNAGGKTVALKTVGLSVLMAQSGIPVPAAGAELPVFRQARADIGDHQSIDADLSTFSAHIRAVSRFLREAEPPALFLFDEIGTGTEPSEGASLATAVLDRLNRPGHRTVATTHLGTLKAWAFTTPGAASAAMEFDTETLRPTFRILPGAAGVSAGLEIAERLGLDTNLVDRARRSLDPGGRQAEAYLARLRERLTEVERLQERLQQRLATVEEEEGRLRARAEQDAERRREGAARALEAVVSAFREEAKAELVALRDRRERVRLEKEAMRREARLRSEMTHRRSELQPAARGDALPPDTPLEPRPGLTVHVRSLGRDGEVVALRGDRVEVRLGTTVFTVERGDLRPARLPAASPPRASAREHVGSDPGGSPPKELLLLGLRVEEALEQVDRFLDAVALSGLGEVRLVHGHGTGRLKTEIRKFLRGHPHVASWRAGGEGEGGDGATVVTLR